MSGKSRSHLPPPFINLGGFTLQLFAVTVLPLTVLLLIITFGSLNLHHQAMRALVGERDLRATRAAAGAIGDQVLQRGLILHWIASQSMSYDTAKLPTPSNYLDSIFDGGFALFSSNLELLHSTDDAFWGNPTTQTFLDDFLSTASPQPAFSNIFHPDSHPSPFVFLSAQNSEGLITAAAFSPVSLIQTALAGSLDINKAVVLVLDKETRPIYHSGEISPGEGLLSGELLHLITAGETGISYSRHHGEEHVTAYTTIEPIGWRLVMEEAWQEITNPMLRTTQIAPLILVPILVLAVLALWFGAAQIIRPLQTLETQAQELASGNYSAVEQPVGGIPEIQSLQGRLIHMSRRLEAAQESLRSYIGSITKSQEDERRRLARELHDDTLQSLIALNQRIQIARMDFNRQQGGESLQEIEVLNEKSIQNLRRLTRALRPIYLEDLGLPASLEILAQEASSTLRIPVNFHFEGEESRLSPEEELSLYRISQEGLSNIARHSKASFAEINLSYKEGAVQLTIMDNGCGFNLPETTSVFAKQGHFGLLGLYERAELIGAKLNIQTSPGKGTILIVDLKGNASSLQPGSHSPLTSSI
jgi:signal transduction histidine kinase